MSFVSAATHADIRQSGLLQNEIRKPPMEGKMLPTNCGTNLPLPRSRMIPIN
jgi:hypothetical protein